MAIPPVPGLLEAGDRARLTTVLERSRALGFLGPGPVDAHIDRSVALLPLLGPPTPPRRALDLGSGGGVPGLVLAVLTPSWEWILLDGSVKRTAFLAEAVDELALGPRIRVRTERAEDTGRSELRGQIDVVVARGFAASAPTAECAAPLLRAGGRLVVTEPPGGAPERWPADPLATLGLVAAERSVTPVAAQVLLQQSACPDRYPRRNGIPVKRPLW